MIPGACSQCRGVPPISVMSSGVNSFSEAARPGRLPVLNPALLPVLTPARLPVLTPALLPVLTPARLPILNPASPPVLVMGLSCPGRRRSRPRRFGTAVRRCCPPSTRATAANGVTVLPVLCRLQVILVMRAVSGVPLVSAMPAGLWGMGPVGRSGLRPLGGTGWRSRGRLGRCGRPRPGGRCGPRAYRGWMGLRMWRHPPWPRPGGRRWTAWTRPTTCCCGRRSGC
jgi:hypothetical protein